MTENKCETLLSEQPKKNDSGENPPKTKLNYVMTFKENEVKIEQIAMQKVRFGESSSDKSKDKKNPKKIISEQRKKNVPTAARLVNEEKKEAAVYARRLDIKLKTVML
ncbi:hypothetical protein FQR65_LT01613 [Abscondita terminalis]|nr:hypothetical protein FQR65_LT01613 [Abscondita terminalis]